MFHRLLAAVALIFLMPSVLFAAQFESASTFQSEDCERYLSGAPGKALLQRAKEWLSALPPVTVLSPRRVDKSDEPHEESVVLNPKLIWFLEHPNSTYEDVLKRYHEARDRSDQYHLNRVRSLPSPTHDQILADITRRDKKQREIEQQTLTALEMGALGLPGQMPITLGGMHARLVPQPDSLRIEVLKEEDVVGQFNLPLSSMRAGFRNLIPLWQATQLEGEEPDFEATIGPKEQRKEIQQFLNEQGQFALFREAGDFLFAYGFGMHFLESDPSQVSGLTLDISVAKPCTPSQMAETDFSYPPMAPGQASLCFSDTFLKLRLLIRHPSTMNVEQPSGFSERKYQL